MRADFWYSRGMAHTGRRIAKAREEAGLRQVDLAQAVGVSETAVQKWESGENEPRTRNLMRIAEVLGRSVA